MMTTVLRDCRMVTSVMQIAEVRRKRRKEESWGGKELRVEMGGGQDIGAELEIWGWGWGTVPSRCKGPGVRTARKAVELEEIKNGRK